MFKGPISDDVAERGLMNYQGSTTSTQIADCRGMWFDTGDINKYMQTTLSDILNRHAQHEAGTAIPNGYEWKIGFYWYVKNDSVDSKSHLGFFVVPILVNPTTNDVLDYFDTNNNLYYAHSHPLTKGKDFDGENNVYDEGHLWP
jgi:Zn-finger nucleic acid-binding protein